MTRKVAWFLLSQSHCCFSFPSLQPRTTLAGSWFIPCFPCGGLRGAKTGPALAGGHELICGSAAHGGRQPRPQARPCAQAPRRPFLKPSSPNTTGSQQPATGVFLVWLLTQTVSRKDGFKHSLSFSFPPTVGLVISGSRGSHVHVYAHGHSERPVLSHYHHTDPRTHVSMLSGASRGPRYIPMGRTSLSFITSKSSGLTSPLFTTELCISSANRLSTRILESFLFYFVFTLILEREEGRGRERNMDIREKYQSAISHMCPDRGSNLQPSYMP